MALDILELRKLCIPKNIRITLHAAKRLEQRGIFLKDVISCIMNSIYSELAKLRPKIIL